eukprot:RCo039121
MDGLRTSSHKRGCASAVRLEKATPFLCVLQPTPCTSDNDLLLFYLPIGTCDVGARPPRPPTGDYETQSKTGVFVESNFTHRLLAKPNTDVLCAHLHQWNTNAAPVKALAGGRRSSTRKAPRSTDEALLHELLEDSEDSMCLSEFSNSEDGTERSRASRRPSSRRSVSENRRVSVSLPSAEGVEDTHLVFQRRADGVVVARAALGAAVEVNGECVLEGQDVLLQHGHKIRLGNYLLQYFSHVDSAVPLFGGNQGTSEVTEAEACALVHKIEMLEQFSKALVENLSALDSEREQAIQQAREQGEAAASQH